MSHSTCLVVAAALIFSVSPAWAAPFSFSTGQPDAPTRMAAATRVEGSGLIEIEAADDFITTAEQTTITAASFFGLLPFTAIVSNIDQVAVEIYRVFPLDSANPPDGRVPTRTNSPSDVAFDVRSSDQPAALTFAVTNLGNASTTNSVLNGINPIPLQTTGGEGPATGALIRIDVTLVSPFRLPPGHYFFVPQVRTNNGVTFFWLSAAGNNPPQFTGDLQAWIRNANLDPDWLRIGTDIVGGAPAPTFNMAFSLTGTTEAALPAVAAAILPSSRSVQVGTPATAFATVINPGPTTVNGVGISINAPGGIPATFSYQTTDPTTNLVTGTPNAPASIPPLDKQTFVIALTPTAAIPPTDVSFSFGGGNAPVISGVNTLLFSASTTPVADIVALAATAGNDGIVNIPGSNGNGAFAVAIVNVGASGTISVSVDTGTAQLPVILFLCQTNSATGQCVNPPGPTPGPIALNVNAQGTATFGIFVAGTGNVPFFPGTNRIFVRFKDAGGAIRGTTSVAVRTQ